MQVRQLLTVTSLAALTLAPFAEATDRRGGDERVNTTTASTQKFATTAVYNGGWVSAWQSREGTADLEIRARVYSGHLVGPELEVTEMAPGTQQEPDVAADANGNFAVVWYSNEPGEPGGDDSGLGIVARLFMADGTPLTLPFQVNDLTQGNQLNPRIAMAADGRFVITWRSNGSLGSDQSGASVQARLFAADGTPEGPGFQVNTYTTFDQQRPAVDMTPAGHFVIAWQSLLQDGSIDGIYARRYSANGTPQTGERQINVLTSGAQSLPTVAMTTGGRYLIAWQSEDDNNGLEVRARLFGTNDQNITGEFNLNTLTDGAQRRPAVAALQNGFLTVWQSDQTAGSDSDGSSIQVRPFDLDGQPMGPELQLNTATEGNQENPAVDGSGLDLAILWDSEHLANGDEDIFAFDDNRAWINATRSSTSPGLANRGR